MAVIILKIINKQVLLQALDMPVGASQDTILSAPSALDRGNARYSSLITPLRLNFHLGHLLRGEAGQGAVTEAILVEGAGLINDDLASFKESVPRFGHFAPP